MYGEEFYGKLLDCLAISSECITLALTTLGPQRLFFGKLIGNPLIGLCFGTALQRRKRLSQNEAHPQAHPTLADV